MVNKQNKHYHRIAPRFAGLAMLSLLLSSVQGNESVEEYIDLPLADLLSMEVTSISKKKQQLNEVAAAVFVITREDIRRSGVTSIPEALRMAPGIQVGRIDANKWAVSSRGFNNQFSNMLLVMIDGRTVYNSSFSGVYWDAQDTLLEDIERIEVIRGPGASVWGANAVNGVINIITRQASKTLGGYLTIGAGNEDKVFSGVRYGIKMDNGITARAYMKYNDRDSFLKQNTGSDAGDEWQSLRGGFRIDSQPSETDNWTIIGDAYQLDENQRINIWKDPADQANMIYAPHYLATNIPDNFDSSGWSILGRWDHQFSADGNSTLQVYIDHTKRAESVVTQKHDTIDLDFQHEYRGFKQQEIIWGFGYRRIRNTFDNSFSVAFLPDRTTLDLYSAFIQDEISLTDTLRLTLGSKFEHNDFTGFEIQPNVRMAWLPDTRNTVWASVSRAVRTPSRLESGSKIVTHIESNSATSDPDIFYSLGNENFQSEELLAWEMGYRLHPQENLSLDFSLFYNDYDKLQTFESTNPPDSLSNIFFDNKLSAYSYGLELSIDWRPLGWWRLQSNYSYMDMHATPDSDSVCLDISNNNLAENSYLAHQLSLRSMMNLRDNISLDVWVYYVDELKHTFFPTPSPVPSYTSLNVRLAWRPANDLELSLTAQNLLDKQHLEFVGQSFFSPSEIEQSAYVQIRWDY
ncbi:TonB-dependent receptor plug domain-containing protein [Thiolapillus sp.]